MNASEFLSTLPDNPLYQSGTLIYPPRGQGDIAKLMEAFAASETATERDRAVRALEFLKSYNRVIYDCAIRVADEPVTGPAPTKPEPPQWDWGVCEKDPSAHLENEWHICRDWKSVTAKCARCHRFKPSHPLPECPTFIKENEVITGPRPLNKQVPERTISDECKYCAENEPEWSPYAKCWIHRRPSLDKRCTRKIIGPCGEMSEAGPAPKGETK